MSFVKCHFEYNGIKSSDMGVLLVKTDNSPINQAFTPQKTLYKSNARYSNKHSYYGADKIGLSLPIKLIKIDNISENASEFTYEERVKIMQWLCPDDLPHPFISEDFPFIEFWVVFNKSQFINYSNNMGILEIEGELIYPYPLSPLSYSRWDLEDNATSTIIDIENKSNTDSFHTINELKFTLVGDSTSFKIINHTNGGEMLEFKNLTPLESVTINSNEEIISSTGNERISNNYFNFGFEAVKLPYGINKLEVFGKCILEIKQKFPMQL